MIALGRPWELDDIAANLGDPDFCKQVSGEQPCRMNAASDFMALVGNDKHKPATKLDLRRHLGKNAPFHSALPTPVTTERGNGAETDVLSKPVTPTNSTNGIPFDNDNFPPREAA